MAGDDVTKEVKTVNALDHKLQVAEEHHDAKATKAAQDALQHEIQTINAQGNGKAVMSALHKVDPHSHLKLGKDGQLHMTPLQSAGHGQSASPTRHPDETRGAEAKRPTDDMDDLGHPPRPETAIDLSIEAEQDLLRGGSNSLYDKVVKAPGNERANALGLFPKSQDPNSPETTLERDDFERYAALLKAKGAKLSADDKRDQYVVDNLLKNWNQIVPNIGDFFDGDMFISKKSMGMNLARASAHDLLDGGANNLFDKIAKETDPYKPAGQVQLRGYNISNYIEKHGNEMTKEQRDRLSYLATRLEGGRDWAAGLIGWDNGEYTTISRMSIQQGLEEYNLDSFVVK